MIDKNREKEARSNYGVYLNQGLIKREEFKRIIFETYMRNYKESLNVTQKLYIDNTSSLWVIVSSYYSMFYLANAVIYTPI